MQQPLPRRVVFFRTQSGGEPVREWLKNDKQVNEQERTIIGEDIKTVQWSHHLKKPHASYLGGGLWEVRSTLPNRIARVIFCECDGSMILLNGFIKKNTAYSAG
jgi:Phage derived protein Gp49-like (DUF891)